MTTTEQPPTPSTQAVPQARHWTGLESDNAWITLARELAVPLADRAAAHDLSGEFVHHGFDLLKDRRLMALLVPTELGGLGATHAEACAVLSELAVGCPATALSYAMHSHLVAAQVWRHHRDLPAPVLAKVAADQTVLISTGASDWIESSGTARQVDDGYVVSAAKLPASGCPAGDVLVTSIRWDDAPDGPQILHCAVPFSADGVSIVETWDTMGMRGTGSHTVVLDDVFVPETAVALMRPADQWHPVWATVLGAALPLIMACYVGVAEAAAARAVELAGPKADRADTAPLVGRMYNRLTVARDSVRAMIDASQDLRFDNTIETAAASLTRKTNAAEASIDTVRLALEVAGGFGYSRAAGLERLLRDVQGGTYHPLPAAQQERFTGLAALGRDPVGGQPV